MPPRRLTAGLDRLVMAGLRRPVMAGLRRPVMAGLDPAIYPPPIGPHATPRPDRLREAGRVKPGHDG